MVTSIRRWRKQCLKVMEADCRGGGGGGGGGGGRGGGGGGGGGDPSSWRTVNRVKAFVPPLPRTDKLEVKNHQIALGGPKPPNTRTVKALSNITADGSTVHCSHTQQQLQLHPPLSTATRHTLYRVSVHTLCRGCLLLHLLPILLPRIPHLKPPPAALLHSPSCPSSQRCGFCVKRVS
jgi:hypothetical protein